MRTTVAIDDELMEQAREYTGLTENAALIREALKTLVAVEAGRRLAGSEAPIQRLKHLLAVGQSCDDPCRHLGLDRSPRSPRTKFLPL